MALKSGLPPCRGPGRLAAMHPQRAINPLIFIVAAWILRIGLGGWFIASGVLKIWDDGLVDFTRHIQNYQLILPGGLDFTKGPWDAVAAYTVPWVEIVAGCFLAAGCWRLPTLLVFSALVAVFAICIGWAWAHGLDIACGCHGGDAPLNYWGKVAEFVGYYTAFGLLFWLERITATPESRSLPEAA